ncbi:IclR family transcriptional regulator [Streptomyces sp. NPDC059650]|uniref:IclR family transcriptional regulator n=1 Tax=Streptomyces sp. NPDC059650 TaxID=3346896 RepID=UPI0036C3F2F1
MLARGLSVLRCFRPGEPELQLSEIARRADMPKATAHRIISELVDEGMLERGERGLRLGVALFALGARVPRQLKLRSLAFPYAEQLHHVTRANVFIFISDASGPDAALVDAVRRVHGGGAELGTEDEAWASVQAATRIFRAFAGDQPAPFPASWGESEGDAGRVRHQGFVAVRSATGAVGIAAPVLTASNTAVGALAVTGPQGRLQAVGAVSHLRAACAAVSRALQRTPDMAPAR